MEALLPGGRFERVVGCGFLSLDPAHFIRLVADDCRLRVKANKNIIGVVQYLDETLIPMFQLPHVAAQQSPHSLFIVWL